MKTSVLAAIIALPFSGMAQQATNFNPFPDNGVYLSAADFSKHTLTDGFDDGQPGYQLREEAFQSTVKITQPNTKEVKIPLSDLWGERQKGVDYRNFDGEIFRVEHTDRIFLYSRPASVSGDGGRTVYPSTSFYFSREANSPIHFITAENLKEIYYDQPSKLAAFDDIDALNTNSAEQAQKLLRIFYTDNGVNSTGATKPTE